MLEPAEQIPGLDFLQPDKYLQISNPILKRLFYLHKRTDVLKDSTTCVSKALILAKLSLKCMILSFKLCSMESNLAPDLKIPDSIVDIFVSLGEVAAGSGPAQL